MLKSGFLTEDDRVSIPRFRFSGDRCSGWYTENRGGGEEDLVLKSLNFFVERKKCGGLVWSPPDPNEEREKQEGDLLYVLMSSAVGTITD